MWRLRLLPYSDSCSSCCAGVAAGKETARVDSMAFLCVSSVSGAVQWRLKPWYFLLMPMPMPPWMHLLFLRKWLLNRE